VQPARRKLYSYAGVVALYVLVFGWWIFFFAHQSEFLLRRLGRSGTVLDEHQTAALRHATDESMRMFLFEGSFLGLLLLASLYLVVRSLQRELALHRQQSNFLSAVTHELRSPLASARLYIDSLLAGRAEDKRERYLRNARSDLDRLSGIVDQVLESARAANSGVAVAPERVELQSFVPQALEQLGREAPLAGLKIEAHAPEPLTVQADPSALHTILRNLLSNAAKYAGATARVEVSTSRHHDHGRLLVRDFGPGLQGADARRIFEPFVRGGDELVRTQQGVGLGLFMVAELARAQGGRARALTELDGGGFGVEIALPLRAEA
jgi:signal transduction histidine kinase